MTASASQATSLLGRTVDFEASSITISGLVQSVSFTTGQPTLTIKTPDGNTIANVPIADISQVR